MDGAPIASLWQKKGGGGKAAFWGQIFHILANFFEEICLEKSVFVVPKKNKKEKKKNPW
jgi:hypothetical protein